MSSSVAQRIVRVHPAILTGFLLISLPVQLVASGLGAPPPVRGVLTAAFLGAICGWVWAIFEVSKPAMTTQWATVGIFAAPPLLGLIAGLASWSTHNSPVAFAIFGFLFVGLWLGASTLEKADQVNGHTSVGRIWATLFLMYFSFVGVWALHSKIMRVADRSAASV